MIDVVFECHCQDAVQTAVESPWRLGELRVQRGCVALGGPGRSNLCVVLDGGGASKNEEIQCKFTRLVRSQDAIMKYYRNPSWLLR